MLMQKPMALLLASLLSVGAMLSADLWAAAQTPHEIVEETSQQVLEIIDERGRELEQDPEARNRLVDEIIGPVVDFEVFSQLVLGTHWRTATPEQRERFMAAFQDMLVRTYTKSLSDFAGTQVTVLPPRGEQREEYRTVYTEIRTGRNQPPLSVAYSFRLDDGQWRAYDLTIDGLSLVKNFRSSFDNEIERHGLNALITRLERGGEGLAPDTTVQ
jgi:phospholipid transport system substrate-binding protein